MCTNLRAIVTHGMRAGSITQFDPDNDRASMKQFIWAGPETLERIERIDREAFRKYLDASGTARNPSLSSAELLECIDAVLDTFDIGTVVSDPQQWAREIFEEFRERANADA